MTETGRKEGGRGPLKGCHPTSKENIRRFRGKAKYQLTRLRATGLTEASNPDQDPSYRLMAAGFLCRNPVRVSYNNIFPGLDLAFSG